MIRSACGLQTLEAQQKAQREGMANVLENFGGKQLTAAPTMVCFYLQNNFPIDFEFDFDNFVL